MKRWLLGALAAGIVFAGVQAPASAEQVPKEIYEWVQSTARASYYFNRDMMSYGVDKEGHIDLNIITVPTICMYDNIQIQDVVSKRRWKMLPLAGYESLQGEAEYLQFDLRNKTVQVVRHDDLDDKWGTLDTDTSGKPVSLDSFSEKDVDGIFYRKILDYAKAHRDDLIKRSKGTLTEADRKLIEEEKKAELKAKEAEKKAAEKAEKERKKKEKKEKENKEEGIRNKASGFARSWMEAKPLCL